MNAASVQTIRAALKELDRSELAALCLRLARFKSENKELISFILFDAAHPAEFLNGAHAEIDELFSQVNVSHVFYAKKTLRKILRMINKNIRITASDKSIGVELLIRFLTNFQGMKMNWKKEKLLRNMYDAQLKKAKLLVASLHEDLRHDYDRHLQRLEQA